jgi:hypothetical protein
MQTHPSCDKAYHRARFAQSICVRISQKSEIFRRIPLASFHEIRPAARRQRASQSLGGLHGATTRQTREINVRSAPIPIEALRRSRLRFRGAPREKGDGDDRRKTDRAALELWAAQLLKPQCVRRGSVHLQRRRRDNAQCFEFLL